MQLHRPQSDQVPSPFRARPLARDSSRHPKRRPASGWRPLPVPHHISGITEECQKLSRPAKTQRTDPTISLDRKSGPTTTAKSRNKALSSKHQCTSTFQVLLGYLCRPQCTFASRGHQSWLPVLVLLDADSLLGGEALDLTDPNVVDHLLQLAWSGSIGFAVGALPTQRPARRSFGKHGIVAAM